MRDLDKALADILAIRTQIAAGTAFRGYGPTAIAVTAVLASSRCSRKSSGSKSRPRSRSPFFSAWVIAALISAAIVWIEMRTRSHRHHSGLADAMIYQAIEQFLPAGVAGALLGIVLWQYAPEALWMLPGIWQVMVSLGIFASTRSLPRIVTIVGAWYFVAGFVVLMLASQSHALSPWTMGLPFVIGQLLMAIVLHFASGDADGEA